MRHSSVCDSGDEARRILVLRPGAIGDTLLSLPALRALRRRFPAAEITVVGNRAPLRLGQNAGIFDRHDAFGAAWVSDLFGDAPTPALRERLTGVDLGVVWMHSAEAAADLARRLHGAGVGQSAALVSFPPTGSRRHLADHLIDTLAPLGISGPRPRVRLAGNPESRIQNPEWGPGGGETDRVPILARQMEHHDDPNPVASSTSGPVASSSGRRVPVSPRPRVVLHPGAGGRHKRWPAGRFAVLADRLADGGLSVALTCGPADEEAVADVRSAVRRAELDVLVGLGLDELAGILAGSTLFVGNDSGITHLAALLGVPTVALFGPFDPVYWAPIGPRVVIVDAGRACPHRDDPRDGCRRCDALASLEVDVVWEATRRALGEAGEGAAPPAPERAEG